MKQKKYQIINTTVKPPRKDALSGKDLRSATEMKGFGVAFKDSSDDRRVELYPQSPPAIIGQLNEGILRLFRGGLVSITEVDDVVTALKAHTLAPTAARVSPLGFDNEEENPLRKAKAVEMGKDTYAQKSGKEYEGAVNPDGDPNFVVTAIPRARRKKKVASNE